VCTDENKEYLLQYAPELAGRIDPHLRAIINTQHYPYTESGRTPDTLLFAGSFNHQPNVQGLLWFLNHVFPRVLAARPQVRLIVAGSGNIEALRPKLTHSSIDIRGFVPDIVAQYNQCAVLICPVLSGSGIRVKLLEAFATGIPVVSTHLGAEGFTRTREPVCALADDPSDFADRTLELLADPPQATAMARRARALIESRHDAKFQIARLLQTYRESLAAFELPAP
jgi:glycosyltransferase involved in cell wall biosynthesis